MNVTLSMGITNAVLDPIFIFGLDLGINGAAMASACAAIVSAAVAIVPVIKSYGGFRKIFFGTFPDRSQAGDGDLVASHHDQCRDTPVGGFISYRFIAGYSDDVVAGFAVMGRITPVAFCLLFSLSGAVGPIIGQNFGAQKFDRIRLTIQQAMLFALGYTLLIWPLLLLLNEPIADIFNLEAQGRELFWIFALVLTPLFFFNGMLFIANAACNNLERPAWSTIMNWLRNTLGLIPFLWIGGALYGLEGILIGPAIGGIIFGVLGYAVSRHLVNLQEAKAHSRAA